MHYPRHERPAYKRDVHRTGFVAIKSGKPGKMEWSDHFSPSGGAGAILTSPKHILASLNGTQGLCFRLKVTLITLIFLFSCCLLYATDFTVDGIKYRTTGTHTVAVIIGYDYAGDLSIPSTISYAGEIYTVTSIGHEAFASCTSLTSITIPYSLHFMYPAVQKSFTRPLTSGKIS
jgi:hypothetical protein